MKQSKMKCYLPEVVTAGMVMDFFGLAGREFELIARSKDLPMFRTECNRYYVTDSVVSAIKEFIAESGEIDCFIPAKAFPILAEMYRAMFRMTKPREREYLRAIQCREYGRRGTGAAVPCCTT